MGWFIDRQIDKFEMEMKESIKRMDREMLTKTNLAIALELGTIDEEQYMNLMNAVNKEMDTLRTAVNDLFKLKVDKRIKKKKAA